MSAAPMVLLVDDFQDALNMYSEYLDFRGYRVVTASSGAAALTAAKAHPPDVVFMDLRMPLMTGA